MGVEISPYSLVEHEVGNIIVKARIASLDDGVEIWDEFGEFLESHENYEDAFMEGDVEQRQRARQEVESYYNLDETPERSRSYIEMALEAYDAVEAFEEALNEGPVEEPVTLGEVLSGVEKEGELRDMDITVGDYEEDTQIWGNEALWILPHTAAINAYRHGGDPEINVSVDQHEDAVYVVVSDDGPGIDKDREELLEGDGKGFPAIDYITDRYGGSWSIDGEDGTEVYLKFRKV